MIVGIGVDLLDNGRIKRELASRPWSRSEGIFTPQEIEDCSAARRPWLRYAACFCAKEAALKAFGGECTDLALFREIEMRRLGVGKLAVTLHGRLKQKSHELRVRHINLSIGSTREHTAAMVILEA